MHRSSRTRAIYITVITTVVLLLNGCFGGFVRRPKTGTLINPELRNRPIMRSLRKPRLEAELIDYWGRPDRIETENGRNIYVYEYGTKWCGLCIIAIVVPIPLVLPLGNSSARFTVQNGHVTSVTATSIAENRIAIGLLPNDSFESSWPPTVGVRRWSTKGGVEGICIVDLAKHREKNVKH